MADAGGADQLGFSWFVDDQATKPLSEIEKSYVGLMKSMDTVMRQTNTLMKDFNDRAGDAGEAADEAGEKTKKSVSKFEEMDEALRGNVLGLDRLGISWDKFIKFLGAASVGAALVGVIVLFTKAVQKAAEFESQIAKLTEVYAGNARETRAISSAVLGLQGRAGFAREEVLALTRAMLDIGLVPRVAEKAGISFKELAATTLDLSAATGLSGDSAASFVDQLIRINRVPPTAIRGIGAAIKNVADNSKITTDELVAFNKSLEPLLAQLGLGGDDATKFTGEMAALAGVLSDVGIDATKVTSGFAEMLDETSAAGNLAAGQLANFAGIGVDALRDMIANNPAALMDQIADRAGAMDPTNLKNFARILEESGTGFGRTELLNLARFSKESEQSFQERAKLALEESARQGKLADIAARRQARLEGILNSFQRMWDNIMITIGGAVLDNVIPPLRENLMPLMKDLTKFIRNMDWNAVFAEVIEFIKDTIDIAVILGTVIKDVFVKAGERIGKTIGIATTIVSAFTDLFQGKFGLAKEKALIALEGIQEMLWDTFTFVPRTIFKAFGVDIDAFLSDMSGKITEWATAIVPKFVEVLKMIGEVIIATLGKPFELAGKGIDAILESFGVDTKVSDILGKASDKFASLLGMDKPKPEARPARGNLSQALNPVAGTPGLPGVAGPAGPATVVQQNTQMVSRSPQLESLAERQLRLTERQVGLLEQINRGGGSGANRKIGLTLANSGAS